MQEEENKTVDIDTSGPGAEVILDNEAVSPMTHLRNLVSSQMFKMMNKKTKNWKTIVKMFKEE